MLTYYFPSLGQNKIIKKINGFLYSTWFMGAVALLMALSNVFAWEFFVFYAYTAVCVYTALFAEDGFPFLPMFCCGYMLFSANNNPVGNYGNTIFSNPVFKIQFIILVIVVVLSLLTRLLFEVLVVKRKQKTPSLTYGFIALGIAYILGGVGSSYYGLDTLFYGFVQILSISLTYFYLYYTVDWSKRKKEEAPTLLICIGLGMLAEIAGMYLKPEVLQALKEGTFTRGMLKSGWGVYNNVGGIMALLMPAPFYFACTKKQGWLWILLGTLFFGGVIMTQSRGAITTGAIVYIACLVFTLVYTKKEERKKNLIAVICIFSAVAGGILLLWLAKGSEHILLVVMNLKWFDPERLKPLHFALDNLNDCPLFGVGFYETGNLSQYGENLLPEGYFLPPRYHNTIAQLAGVGGFFALGAYAYHRYQTVKLFTNNPAPHKTFLGLSLCAHLIASLIDCHFFNLGPGLLYGVLLLFAERLPQE